MRDLAANAAAQAETRLAIIDARERLETARAAAEEQSAARTLGDIKNAIETTKAARVRLEDCEAELQELQALFSKLESQSHGIERDIGYARQYLKDAVQAVAWPIVQSTLLVRYRAAQREQAKLATTLRAIQSGIIPPNVCWHATRPNDPVEIDLAWPKWVKELQTNSGAEAPAE